MDFVKKLFILALLGFSSIALAASFPTGVSDLPLRKAQ
jgi:hypothetical protein